MLATLRPEFLDPLAKDPDLSQLARRIHEIRPLDSDALRSVIEEPAKVAGLSFEADLVTRLVTDTGSGDALPLLAFTLEQLAHGVKRGDQLTHQRYADIGGVQGALQRQADAALQDACSNAGVTREQVISALLGLVTIDEQGRPTKRRVALDEFAGAIADKLEPFVDRRLLSTEAEGERTFVAVAHEAFLVHWPPLKDEIDAQAAALRARRVVENAANDWVAGGRDEGALLHGRQLAKAAVDIGAELEPVAKSDGDPSVWAKTALEVTGVVARPAAAGHWRRTQRRGTGIPRSQHSHRSIPPPTSNHAGGRRHRDPCRRRGPPWWDLSEPAPRERAQANLGRRPHAAAQRSRGHAGQNRTRRRRASLAANPGRPRPRSAPPTADCSTRSSNGLTTLKIITAGGPVSGVAFSPDGHRLASAGDDARCGCGTPTPANPRQPRCTGHTGGVNGVAFSPDGHRLASAATTHGAAVERRHRPTLGAPLTGHTGPVSGVALAPTGTGWPAPAATARCGCGTPTPANRSAPR